LPRNVVPGAWSIAASPNVSAQDYLNQVSCISVSFCMLVGADSSVVDSRTLIEEWNGSIWSIVPSPSVPGSDDDILNTVSCVGPSLCEAVGYSYTGLSTYVTEALTWNGTSWALQAPANPAVNTPGSDRAELFGVSCLGGQFCIATGDARPGAGESDQTLIESTPVIRPGYRFAAGDGGVFALGGANFHGSAGALSLVSPIVGMSA
jgi:hypothetical protein